MCVCVREIDWFVCFCFFLFDVFVVFVFVGFS